MDQRHPPAAARRACDRDAVALRLLVTALVAASAAVAGCADEILVGNACHLAREAPPSTIALSSPSLDCVSRICLSSDSAGTTGGPIGMCTADCASDDDCVQHELSACESGFVCAIATTTGPFCCRSMCVCQDDVALLPSPQPEPTGCDPDLPENTCVNLPDR